MGIKKKTFLVVTCDICDIELDSAGYGGFTVYGTDEEAKEAMNNCEWTKKNGKVRCDSCYEQ